MQAGMSDPDYQGKTGLLLCNAGKEECAWNRGDPLGRLLVLPCPVTNINDLGHPTNQRTTTAEGLGESKCNIERVVAAAMTM